MCVVLFAGQSGKGANKDNPMSRPVPDGYIIWL